MPQSVAVVGAGPTGLALALMLSRQGRRVVVQSSTATGEYRIVEAEYAGETRGEDWGVDLVCRDIALDAPLIV